MADIDGRGILYPARLPTFHREAAPQALAGIVRWFWIPQWHLAPGRSSRQEVLAFPASNLTVEPSGVTVSGPTTRRSHRDLHGRGWAVGALLRPAGVAALGIDPRGLRDGEIAFDAPDLHRAVAAAMETADDARRRTAAAEAYASWITDTVDPPDAEGDLANTLEDVIAADRSLVRVEQVAERLGLSVRSVQRLARRYVGVPPLAIIRRYRLQDAAQVLRDDPSATVGRIAADLGYADQAHLCADFRAVLGFTPTTYRRVATLDSDSSTSPT